MIADMISNKKINRIEPELFIRGRKLIISTAFISTVSHNLISQYQRMLH